MIANADLSTTLRFGEMTKWGCVASVEMTKFLADEWLGRWQSSRVCPPVRWAQVRASNSKAFLAFLRGKLLSLPVRQITHPAQGLPEALAS